MGSLGELAAVGAVGQGWGNGGSLELEKMIMGELTRARVDGIGGGEGKREAAVGAQAKPSARGGAVTNGRGELHFFSFLQLKYFIS
jgi:hypothetical protein